MKNLLLSMIRHSGGRLPSLPVNAASLPRVSSTPNPEGLAARMPRLLARKEACRHGSWPRCAIPESWRLPKIGAIAVALLTAAAFAHAQPAAMPKVGDKAPHVTGKDQDGKTWKLDDLIGTKRVVLFFYPKDNTPGCTKEACGFRDQMDAFKKDKVEVIGVSFDDQESHKKFIADHKLNFSLLADTDGKIADAFGVRAPNGNRARRVTFVIGLDGKIAHVTDSPQADAHLSQTKEAIEKLKQK